MRSAFTASAIGAEGEAGPRSAAHFSEDAREMSESFEVFLSHFVEEEPIAECLQDFLHLVFGDGLQVFRSSDDGSIRTGEDQYPTILRALQEMRVCICLVSKYSAFRPWLNFEVGFAKARDDVQLFCVLIRATDASHVPTPIAQLQLRPLATKSVIEEIIGAIAEETKRTAQPLDIDAFLRQLERKEAGLPIRELTMVPFRFSAGTSLGFDLRYNGPRPIQLVKVWAEVPRGTLDTQWNFHNVPGFLNFEQLEVKSKPYLRGEYIFNTGAPDPRHGRSWRPLHPHCPPSAELFLRELRFGIVPTAIAELGDEVVRCQVITKDRMSQVFE
jgi:hypothetical protein